MELIITAAIIIVILLILGVSIPLIVQGILWIMEILLLLMTLFFVLSIIFLLLGKPHDAEFLHIDKEVKWGSAVYRVNGEELQSIYPAEIVMQKLIYQKDNIRVRLWRHGKLYLLFDWYSILVAAIGLPLSAGSAAFLGWFLWQMIL